MQHGQCLLGLVWFVFVYDILKHPPLFFSSVLFFCLIWGSSRAGLVGFDLFEFFAGVGGISHLIWLFAKLPQLLLKSQSKTFGMLPLRKTYDSSYKTKKTTQLKPN